MGLYEPGRPRRQKAVPGDAERARGVATECRTGSSAAGSTRKCASSDGRLTMRTPPRLPSMAPAQASDAQTSATVVRRVFEHPFANLRRAVKFVLHGCQRHAVPAPCTCMAQSEAFSRYAQPISPPAPCIASSRSRLRREHDRADAGGQKVSELVLRRPPAAPWRPE